MALSDRCNVWRAEKRHELTPLFQVSLRMREAGCGARRILALAGLRRGLEVLREGSDCLLTFVQPRRLVMLRWHPLALCRILTRPSGWISGRLCPRWPAAVMHEQCCTYPCTVTSFTERSLRYSRRAACFSSIRHIKHLPLCTFTVRAAIQFTDKQGYLYSTQFREHYRAKIRRKKSKE